MQFKKAIKKGFTLVELVVVIAVIAILAATSVGIYFGVTESAKKSNDQTVTNQMNKALMLDATLNGNPNSPSEALAVLEENGFDVTKMTPFQDGAYYLWDSKENEMILVNKDDVVDFPADVTVRETKYEYFNFIASDSEKKDGFSYYLKDSYTGSTTFSTSVDAGTNPGLDITIDTTLETVNLWTMSGDITVNKADVINHYGSAEFVDIKEVANESYHEFGEVDLINIKQGKVQIESGAHAERVHADGTAKLVVTSNGNVDYISSTTAGSFTVEGTSVQVETMSLEEAKGSTIKTTISTGSEFINFFTGDALKGKLISNIDVTASEKINVTKDYVLDLNGYTWTQNKSKSRMLSVQENVVLTINGTKEGSRVVIPAEAGSYGLIELRGANSKAYLNGGQYDVTCDNGAIVKAYSSNNYLEVNDVNASLYGSMLFDFDRNNSVNSTLKMNNGKYIFGYNVDNREDEETYGLRTPFATSYNSELNNVHVTSKYNTIFTATKGTHTLNNCNFTVMDQIEGSDDDYLNSAISVSFDATVIVNGGKYVGKYGLYLHNSGHDFTNNGGVFEGRVYDYIRDAVDTGTKNSVTGMDGYTSR